MQTEAGLITCVDSRGRRLLAFQPDDLTAFACIDDFDTPCWQFPSRFSLETLPSIGRDEVQKEELGLRDSLEEEASADSPAT